MSNIKKDINGKPLKDGDIVRIVLNSDEDTDEKCSIFEIIKHTQYMGFFKSDLGCFLRDLTNEKLKILKNKRRI